MEMEFRIEKAIVCLMLAAPLAAQDFGAKHQHARGYCQGVLKIAPEGISYRQYAPAEEAKPGKKYARRHDWTWKYEDLQQLEVSPGSLHVLTYEDRVMRMGADREVSFTGDFAGAYLRLRDRMDQRLVARLADEQVQPLWTLPVKQLGRVKGTQGELRVGSDRIVYKTEAKDASRTWRYPDIENISSSGPFQLTITTHERAGTHYGSLKGFNFQLKQALGEEQYNNLWRRINQTKGLRMMEDRK
jgi:hypothetical protein